MLYLSSHSFHIWLFPFLGGVLVSTASIIIKIFSYSCLIFSFQLVDSSLHPLTSLQSTLYSHSSKLCNVNKELNISTISGLVLLSSHCLTSKLVLKHLHSILGKLFSALLHLSHGQAGMLMVANHLPFSSCSFEKNNQVSFRQCLTQSCLFMEEKNPKGMLSWHVQN